MEDLTKPWVNERYWRAAHKTQDGSMFKTVDHPYLVCFPVEVKALKEDCHDLFYIDRSNSGKLSLYVLPSASRLKKTEFKELGSSWFIYEFGPKKRKLYYHKSVSPIGDHSGERMRFIKSLPEGSDFEVIEFASKYLKSIGHPGYVIWWDKVVTRWKDNEVGEFMESVGF